MSQKRKYLIALLVFTLLFVAATFFGNQALALGQTRTGYLLFLCAIVCFFGQMFSLALLARLSSRAGRR
ncbi:MAG: hypothetical protein KBC57_05865 [Neisseriaceae bacterium]|nr:hypothetical protein [Neisseriaceae bacterium]MBP6861867.1 hypothetical protein [Neisseriaceae bacterium]